MSNLRQASLAPLALPLLMLPAVVGALWALLAVFHRGEAGYWLSLTALVGFALYFLGVTLAGQEVRSRLQTRRSLRRILPELTEEAGGIHGQAIWATCVDGAVLWQSPAAKARFGDNSGGDIAGAFKRMSADPHSEVTQLRGRVLLSGQAGTTLKDGRLVVQSIGSRDLLVWRVGDTGFRKPIGKPRTIEGFDALPVAVIGLDASAKITRANAAARILLPGICDGVPLAALLDGMGRSIEDWLDDVVHARISPRPEMLRRKSEGPECFVQVSLARDGKAGLIAVLSDASALKTLEAQFVQSQKMQAIGQLAGGIAHDFNNLLTAITGHCDLLMLSRDETDPEFADISQISQNANRAASLVRQLLAFSRKQTMKPEIIDLRETLSELTHLLNRLVSERVSLNFVHDPALRPIKTDPRQLDQVVMNLVVNARDAMPAGGQIKIRTSNISFADAVSRDRVSIPSGDYVQISVSDEGQGVSADKIDKIFEPFFTTKRIGEGTGLGLSTVYGIVKQSGGYVFCDSVEGEGTTFTLYFPAHDPAELLALQKVESRAAGPDKKLDRKASILLVEDEAAVRAFAARALRLSGFDVSEADSAEAALQILSDSKRNYDVFVTDVVMPGMDGPSWVRTALRDRPKTKVVFISGYSEDIFNDGNPRVENAQFLQKPFSLIELIEVVKGQVKTAA